MPTASHRPRVPLPLSELQRPSTELSAFPRLFLGLLSLQVDFPGRRPVSGGFNTSTCACRHLAQGGCKGFPQLGQLTGRGGKIVVESSK